MKFQHFKNLQPGNKVILNNGREAEVVEIHRGMTGEYLAELFYTYNLHKTFKTPRQIRGLKDA